MNEISALILFPLVAALIIFLIRNDNVRNMVVRISAVGTAAITVTVTYLHFNNGLTFTYPHEETIDLILAVVEVLVAIFIITVGIKNKKYLVSVFSFVQTVLILFFEFTQKEGIEVKTAIVLDKLAIIMVLIVGLVGSLICLYAVGYMKDYHQHHNEFKEREFLFCSSFFVFVCNVRISIK